MLLSVAYRHGVHMESVSGVLPRVGRCQACAFHLVLVLSYMCVSFAVASSQWFSDCGFFIVVELFVENYK
jgi:hypothetical protein